MPLIYFGVLILAITLLVFLVITLFTNPLVVAALLILLGVLWIVLPKIFYGFLWLLFKPYFYWDEKTYPLLKEQAWWNTLVKKTNFFYNKITNPLFIRVLVYGFVFTVLLLAIYLQHNPINR